MFCRINISKFRLLLLTTITMKVKTHFKQMFLVDNVVYNKINNTPSSQVHHTTLQIPSTLNVPSAPRTHSSFIPKAYIKNIFETQGIACLGFIQAHAFALFEENGSSDISICFFPRKKYISLQGRHITHF